MKIKLEISADVVNRGLEGQELTVDEQQQLIESIENQLNLHNRHDVRREMNPNDYEYEELYLCNVEVGP